MSPLLIGVTGLDTYGRTGPKFGLYLRHVQTAGGTPLPLGCRNQKLPGNLAGLLLAGGEDVDPAHYGSEPHPTYRGNRRRDHSEMALARQALDLGLPILAICRGAQLLNVVLGGTLVQDIPSQVANPLRHEKGARHDVRILAGTRLSELAETNRIEINSYHHQAVDRLAPGLMVSATAADGTIEGWEPQADGPIRGYVMAVQYHPERDPIHADGLSPRLFRDFVAAAGRYSTPDPSGRKEPPDTVRAALY